MQGVGPVVQLRISGLVKFGSASSLGGATLAGLQLPTAQRLLGRVGKLDEIRASAKSGVSPKQLVAQIRPILPKDTQVRTGAQQAQQDSSSITSFLSFLKTFLLVFAGVALFVGSFVIANSLSITIAQRTREFATLRTLGASRKQVRRSILVESLVIGTIASVVGLLVGLALAQGLFALFNAVGVTLPNTGTVVKPRTIIVAILVGVIVTVLASLRPAIRATRVEPIAAVREGATIPEGRLARYRTVMRGATAILGARRAAARPVRGQRHRRRCSSSWASGAVLIFIGVALLSARIVPRLATWLGWPATRIAGADRRAGARQHDPQPAAHRVDRVGADDRAGAGHLRDRAVGRDHRQLQGRGERRVHRRLRHHRPEQLLPDPDRRPARRRPAPRAWSPSGTCAPGRGACSAPTSSSPRSTPPSARSCTSTGRTARRRCWRRWAPTGAFVDNGYASKHHLSVGSPLVGDDADRGAHAARRQGHLQATQRRLARSGR